MNRQRFIGLLLAAVAVICAGFYLSSRRDASPDTAGVALLPALATETNSITAVAVIKGSAAPRVTLHKSADGWTVAERADYPADLAKLRKLLTDLRDAKIVENKTDQPARYGAIGVEDPAQAAATGIEVSLTAPAGKQSLIIGKPSGQGTFVRRVGEQQSYSVEPAISVETEPRYWLRPGLIDVPTAQIQSLAVKPANGAPYALHRSNAADGTFALDGAPAGRTPLDGQALAPSATLLARLDAEDVAPVGDIDFGAASQATVTLADGDVITLTGTQVADKHWLQVTSGKNAALKAQTQGRAFLVASYRYDAIFKPVEQFLVAKPVPMRARPQPAAPAP